MRLGLTVVLLLALGLGGCATHATTPSATSAQVSLPAGARPDLDKHWVKPDGNYDWQPNEGFAATPAPMILPAGMLLDRFGSDGGNFLSPKGAPFSKRALPTVCAQLTYKVYRVAAPLLVWTGTAAKWFDEPGGATQFETDAPVYLLIADHVLEPVPYAGEKPCKG
jgi:hypothetical protein